MAAVLAYRLRLAASALLATTGLAAAVALALPVSMPLDQAGPLPLAAVSEARAVAATEGSPPRLSEAADLTRQTLAQRPGDSAAWARLAWIAGEQGEVSDMFEALDRSYAVAPFGPEITGWRQRFAYGRWSSLSPELRRQAGAETAVMVRTRPGMASQVLADITDPSGRLAFMLHQKAAQTAQQRERDEARDRPV